MLCLRGLQERTGAPGAPRARGWGEPQGLERGMDQVTPNPYQNNLETISNKTVKFILKILLQEYGTDCLGLVHSLDHEEIIPRWQIKCP